VVVERGDGDLVAALHSLSAESVGDAFGGSQIRPEEHQQRRAMTGGGRTSLRPVRRWLLHWAGRRDGDPQRLVGARSLIQKSAGLTVNVASVCNW